MSDPERLDSAAVDDAIETLARVWPEFEPRPPQREMAKAVLLALDSGGRIAVEAPTGVGKSIAYLIPVVLLARERRLRVVISTHTKNLQQQITARDAPRVRDVLAPALKIAILKGRTNYLCSRIWERRLQRELLPGAGEGLLDRIAEWVARTRTGDLEEFDARGPEEEAALRRLAAPADVEESALCQRVTPCFLRESRRRAAASHIVVVNHALLLTHHLAPAQVLPEYDLLVVDEAHTLPEVAMHVLEHRVSAGRLRGVLARLAGGDLGLLERVRRLLPRVARGRGDVQAALSEIPSRVADARRAGDAAFRALAAAMGSSERRYRRQDAERGCLGEPIDELILSALALADRSGRVDETLRSVDATDEEAEETVVGFRSAAARLDEFIVSLRFVTEATHARYVYWYEPDPEPALVAAPLEPGEALAEGVFDRVGGALVTSATLSAGGDFSYFLSKLGLDPRATATLAVGSTFDFGNQVLGLAPLSTPPDSSAFPGEVARAVAELVRRVGRKVLVLFTSHALLREVHAHLQAELPATAAVVLGQGVDGQREHVTRAFRSPGRAVLLGTASFWEGVDFPGEELEVLVLTRLPFPVPGDPLVEAQCEKIEAEGESAFTKLMVPEAVLRFRQGFGRLIRRSTDRGVFLVLDGRIRTAGYRTRFRDALPIPLLDTEDVEEAVRRTLAWFETRESASGPSRTGRAREGDRR